MNRDSSRSGGRSGDRSWTRSQGTSAGVALGGARCRPLLARRLRLWNRRIIEEAFDAVNGLGTPGQNFVVADDKGRIGWTIYGSIRAACGLRRPLPVSWADGTRGWSGWLNRDEYPRVLDPQSGRIWTANARVVDGDMLTRIGDGNYEVGSRARIIRERLASQDRFTPAIC